MPKYKVSASRDQKKYSFVFSASSIAEAKQRVHDKWYSILGVEELDESKLSGKKIIFVAEDNTWELKKWKVIWSDIFKVYLKLIDWLWYKVKELYFEEDNINQEDKIKILKKLKQQYKIYQELNFKKKKRKSKAEKFKEQQNNDIKIDNFYLKKELEEAYKLLNFTIKKFRALFDSKNFSSLDSVKINKLQEIYNSLILLKTSTNIWKIQKISETALIKIWEIELELVEKNKTKEALELLKQTNKLLKQVWSKVQFKPDSWKNFEELKSKINIIFKTLKDSFKHNKKKKEYIDKKSTFFLDTILKLKKYKRKLKENNIKILKNIYVFILPFWKLKEKKDRLLIERRLINSNLILLKNKINRHNFSYTKVKKWYNWVIEIILLFFKNIRQYLFIVIFFYSLLFLIILVISYYNLFNLWYLWETINYRGIFYFIVFLFIYFAMYFSKGLYTLILNFIIVLIFVIFGLINF